MGNLELILNALDVIEDLRQRSFEAPLDDMDFRRACADIASLSDDPRLHIRAEWTERLKANEASRYHKRYYNGVFHV